MDYLLLFGIGCLGWLIQALMKAKAIQDKARLANVEFKFLEYFTKDWLSHLIAFTGIGAYLLILSEFNDHAAVNGYVKTLSLFVGWAGADLVSRFFSTVNKKVNAVIDAKSTKSDISEGLDPTVPTPK